MVSNAEWWDSEKRWRIISVLSFVNYGRDQSDNVDNYGITVKNVRGQCSLFGSQ